MQPHGRTSQFTAFPVTTGLLVVIGLVFLREVAAGGSQSGSVLDALGAMYPPLVLEGQVWRLLSAAFLHAGVVHLAVNGFALWQLGRLCEITFGGPTTLALFVFTAITGSLLGVGLLLAGPPLQAAGIPFSFVPHPSVGASGALFGLEGALISFFLRHKERLTKVGSSLLRQLLLWSVGMMVFSFVLPGIDWTAHLGGLLGGMAVGWALPHHKGRASPLAIGAAVVAGLLVVGVEAVVLLPWGR